MRFQFKKVVPALTFVLAIIASFAFRSVNKVHDCVWFIYIGPQSAPANPATLAQAQTKSNWVRYTGTGAPSCPGIGFLCAICVPVTEIDDKGTEELEDDEPIVTNGSNTSISQDLANPNARINGFWQDVSHPTITNHIEAKSL